MNFLAKQSPFSATNTSIALRLHFFWHIPSLYERRTRWCTRSPTRKTSSRNCMKLCQKTTLLWLKKRSNYKRYEILLHLLLFLELIAEIQFIAASYKPKSGTANRRGNCFEEKSRHVCGHR